MTDIHILTSTKSLSDSQQKQLLALNYKFLNYQRMILNTDCAIPDLTLDILFAGNRCAVALDSAQNPIGFCFYRVIKGIMKIRSLFVSEAHRRKYVMTNILSQLVDNEAHTQIVGCVYGQNYLGVQLFKAMGFNCKEDGEWMHIDLPVKNAKVSNDEPSAVAQ